jgi:hypothetical protein
LDGYLALWLGGDRTPLRDAVLSGAVDQEDWELIEQFFSAR